MASQMEQLVKKNQLHVIAKQRSQSLVPTVCVTPSAEDNVAENPLATMSPNLLTVPSQHTTSGRHNRPRLSIPSLFSSTGIMIDTPSTPSPSISSLLYGGRRLSFNFPLNIRRPSWSVSDDIAAWPSILLLYILTKPILSIYK